MREIVRVYPIVGYAKAHSPSGPSALLREAFHYSGNDGLINTGNQPRSIPKTDELDPREHRVDEIVLEYQQPMDGEISYRNFLAPSLAILTLHFGLVASLELGFLNWRGGSCCNLEFKRVIRC